MSGFPRTDVGGVSLPRMIIGSNWFMGYSHTSAAKDKYVKETMTRDKIADVMEVFLAAGIDAVMGRIQNTALAEAVKEAEDRTGKGMIFVSTPAIPVTPDTPEKGFDVSEVSEILDADAAAGARLCMPHQGTTDSLVDRCTRTIRHMDTLCAMIRERDMVPGLSTHMPESIVYADETGLDVETYISLYNSAGFMMQIEVDWVAGVIRDALKPVLTIKPMAAGRIPPFEGLAFAWSTIRKCDMVAVGTMTPDEARECIDISLSIIEGRRTEVPLQETRSKSSVKKTFVY